MIRVRRPPTCFEDLVPDGETCSVRLIVGHKLDEELVSGGDDWRGCNLPAVLPHKLTALVHAISYLDIVVPERGKGGRGAVLIITGSGSICKICSRSVSVEASCTCDN